MNDRPTLVKHSTRVTVAIPVLDGSSVLEATLRALRRQRTDGEVELLICDSGSRDGSVALARRYGAEVIEIAREDFGHGRTRNLLMERSRGAHVAFLSQDAVPVGQHWLERLLEGFALAPDVALAFGPYLPAAGASPMVTREVTEWFASFSPAATPRLDRLGPAERGISSRALLGPRGFFTDANGAVARTAWEAVPFREVPYAEDHVLAHDMLRAGYAKAFLPTAAVVHSHEYSLWDWLRRSFDEARAIRDVYGWAEPLDFRKLALSVWGRVGADRRWANADRHLNPAETAHLLAASTLHHLARTTGTALGSHADRLSPALVRRVSLEGRAA